MFTDDPPDSARRPRVAVLDRTRTAEAVATLRAARERLGQRLEDALRPWRTRAERLPRWTPVAAALVIYLVIALGYFWWPIHSHFDTMAINYGMPDLGQNLWYLKWWPYAVSHGLNPFVTYKMWQAFGYNLSWQTSIPGLSLLALPLTTTAGVVVAYNSWIILSFALTAWTTFILCYHLTRQVWASLIGGYLFGFSGYMLAQGTAHIHLIVLFPVPLLIYLAVLRYQGRISRRRFLLLTPLPLLLFFLVSVEEFALVAIFAYIALGLYFLLDAKQRQQTLRLAIELTAAFLITALVLSPYLYYMVVGYATGIVHVLHTYSGDALGFVIPTQIFRPLYKYFSAMPLAGGNQGERDTYLGLPLAALMIVFAIKRWDKPIGKLLALMALISVLFTLGPDVYIAKVQTIPSPLRYVYRLPLIQKSLPVRYAMFVDLIGALIAALWLAKSVRRLWVKVALGLALTLTLIPNLVMGVYFTPVTIPTFFSTTMYRQYIKPNDTVLMLPLGFYRTDLLWQQATDYAFNLSSGYGGTTPPSQSVSPVELLFNTQEGKPVIQHAYSEVSANAYQYYLEQYIATQHVNDIVVQANYFVQCDPYLQFLHVTPQAVGGIWYYAVPPAFSQATVPGEQVAGEPVSRPYNLSGTATWDETTHQLVVPAKTDGEALETLTDTFAAGTYAATLTIHSTSTSPVAYAEIVVNGQTTTTMLTNGTTRLSLSLPDKTNTVTIRIIGTGGDAFTIGDATMAKV
ncbi:MAG: hypothetical protein OJF49_003478 [Ktedonobacterales bacterium]|jgi:hypothetical protein|nr:MAG: hypothetical protein OJF49_003478 [Ktedonobacterales bacterium]